MTRRVWVWRNGAHRRGAPGDCDTTTQGASIAEAIGATEDAAASRPTRPGGTAAFSSNPPSHTGRLYALALTLVFFFLAWAIVATHPWVAASQDPRLRALAAREAQLRREAALVQTIVARRWAAYRTTLQARKAAIAAAKARNGQPTSITTASSGTTGPSSSVKVVTLPPLTVTRTS